VLTIQELQQFGLPFGKEVRYSKALLNITATPAFTDFFINEELCRFTKDKDYLLGT
jgi:hypothetical protein